MAHKPGLWTFEDRQTGAKTTVQVNSCTPSKIQAAFVTANTALSPANVDSLRGYDSSGRPVRYSSIAFNQNFAG